MDKKADFASILFGVVILFVIGIIFFFVSHFNQEIFSELESEFETDYNNTESMTVLTTWQESDQEVWDYAFLGIFFGVLIALGLTAYAIRISPIFYWIYGLMSLFVLVTGVIVSNVWQEAVANPEFVTTLARFPITNAILGSYYPLVVVAIIMIAMIVIFGKPFGREEGYI